LALGAGAAHAAPQAAGMVVIQDDDFYYFLGVALEGGKTVVRSRP
jgi:hypothetical protein